MSEAGQSQPAESLLAAVYRPAGALYLAFCLAALAAGLWPEAVLVSPAPLRPLHALAVAQLTFGLLVQPLVVLWRAQRGAVRRYWPAAIAEWCVYLFLAVPFYVAAAYIADAVAVDVVRVAIYVACVWTLPLTAGAHFAARRPGKGLVVLVLTLAALALPAAHYVALEFVTPGCARFFARLSPATFAWTTSAARGACWYPRPLWAAFAWPAVAAVGLCLGMLVTTKRPSSRTDAPVARQTK
ncbi:MAG: hypothetical protein ACYTF6_12450 [Planctomycetota bacterium]|jgi:hypothetical protein